MKNQVLRKRIRDLGLHYWQVAEAIGIAASTFTVWLRQELTPDRKERVENAIALLTEKERAGAHHGED